MELLTVIIWNEELKVLILFSFQDLEYVYE